ncbi:MAG: hypothetical protein WC107_01320 [Patescibacteria group bacterium]
MVLLTEAGIGALVNARQLFLHVLANIGGLEEMPAKGINVRVQTNGQLLYLNCIEAPEVRLQEKITSIVCKVTPILISERTMDLLIMFLRLETPAEAGRETCRTISWQLASSEHDYQIEVIPGHKKVA